MGTLIHIRILIDVFILCCYNCPTTIIMYMYANGLHGHMYLYTVNYVAVILL